MLTAIAIDDEPAALEILTRHAAQVPFLTLSQTFLRPAEAMAFLHRQPADVVFLDIQMPDLPGTEFARLLQKSAVPVIFTTAYADYAVEGFALQALDFLLKPIEFGRFLQASNRAFEYKMTQEGEAASVFVKDGYDWVRINLDEVLYIQSDSNLLFIHLPNRRVSTRMTVGEMLALLPETRFLRIHKSYIVATKAIQKIERHQVTVGNATLPLAGSYREEVERRML